ncbi:putative RNA-dependent RNA polymerase 1 [Forsythia ovata]|uniref:RNA-dependent RNA polymerase 1 n=1 Tax=Forsythia ovata TaxID=205694 RepID=A0ABD1TN68_9LAMI
MASPRPSTANHHAATSNPGTTTIEVKHYRKTTENSKYPCKNQEDHSPEPSSTNIEVGTFSTRKRAQIGKGMHILPPSESDLNGFLQFTMKKDKGRYKHICGWQTYFSIQCPSYIELGREFYTTFEFKKLDDFTLNSPRVVQFRLMGKEFKLSITEFNVAFGFINEEYASFDEYLNSACDYSVNFEPVNLYKALSTSNYYDPSKSKDSYLRDPTLKYIHRFLAFTFRVNLSFWLASQFANVVTNKHPLILDSLITNLTVHENLIDLDDNDLHIACAMQPLDLYCLEIMGLVWKEVCVYHFHEPRHIAPRPTRTHPGTTHNERSIISYRPSTSIAPSKGQYDDRFEKLKLQLARMEKNMTTLFAHMGFTPPSPPPSM